MEKSTPKKEITCNNEDEFSFILFTTTFLLRKHDHMYHLQAFTCIISYERKKCVVAENPLQMGN